jgi:hypothetical protein
VGENNRRARLARGRACPADHLPRSPRRDLHPPRLLSDGAVRTPKPLGPRAHVRRLHVRLRLRGAARRAAGPARPGRRSLLRPRVAHPRRSARTRPAGHRTRGRRTARPGCRTACRACGTPDTLRSGRDSTAACCDEAVAITGMRFGRLGEPEAGPDEHTPPAGSHLPATRARQLIEVRARAPSLDRREVACLRQAWPARPRDQRHPPHQLLRLTATALRASS